MPTPLHILILEDDPFDAELEIAILEEAGYSCRWERVETQADFLAQLALSAAYDLVLADYNLPDFDGLTALSLFLEHNLDIPFILVSGTVGEETAIESLKAGATDYVLKDRLSRLGPVVKRALLEKEERQRRHQAEEELRKLSRAVEQSPSLIVITDTEGNIEYINPKFTQVTGYTPEEVIGKNPRILKSGQTFSVDYEQLWQIITTGDEWRGEFYNQKKNGEFFWASASISAIRDSTGTITHFLAIEEDITERKQAEELLKANEENLRITLNSIGDAVIATDANGKITRMNPVAENLTGWVLADAAGKPLTEVFNIVDDQTRKPAESPIEKVLKANEIVGLADHTVLIAKDGTEYYIADSGAPIRNAKGNITGVVLVFRDETEKLKAEQERLKIEKLESVGILAGGIAHDFNNLLTGLFGNIEMAQMLLSNDHKAYKFLESAMYSMESATNLTKQLLTFAKGGDPIKETLSIGEVIAETAQFSVRGSSVKLQINIAPNLWPVEADKGQLSQVISNLVINAQQAMPTGGNITITAENAETPEGCYVQITVQDEGVGIAPQYLDKVFDPYFTTKQKGSGLGLATTHSIIRNHDGQITADSELNQGTVFIIYLPAVEKIEEIAAKNLATNSPARSSARVLVMDDEEMVREVIGAMLEKMGYRASFAVDGQEAVAKYKKAQNNGHPYDAVVLDLTIPGGMGGQEAAQEILKINSHAKLIVSSGYATDPVMANYKDHGFVDRAEKPYLFTDLEKVMQRVLET